MTVVGIDFDRIEFERIDFGYKCEFDV